MVDAWRSMGVGSGRGVDQVLRMIAGFFGLAKGWNDNEHNLITSDIILK